MIFSTPLLSSPLLSSSILFSPLLFSPLLSSPLFYSLLSTLSFPLLSSPLLLCSSSVATEGPVTCGEGSHLSVVQGLMWLCVLWAHPCILISCVCVCVCMCVFVYERGCVHVACNTTTDNSRGQVTDTQLLRSVASPRNSHQPCCK